MARGDTTPPRKHFSDAEDAAPIDDKPKRLRYPCAAHQCPMPGTVFLGGPDSPGQCGYHAREPAHEWPVITQAIKDWECVRIAIGRGRRVLTADVTCSDGKAQREAMQAEWAALVPAVLGSGWKNRLEPRPRESLSEWVFRLDNFLAARVKERQRGSGAADETRPTPFAAEVLAGLRKRRATTDDDFQEPA